MNNGYARNCVEYILDQKKDEFITYIEAGTSQLSEEECKDLVKVVLGEKQYTQDSIKQMKRLESYHIYASAWIASLSF